MESDLANHLERRLRALVLGAIDMYDAWERRAISSAIIPKRRDTRR
jgi:hypothetical protein